MAVAAVLLMPELAGEHRGCTLACLAQSSSKRDIFLANVHPAAWVQCFPWTDMLLESWQAGTVCGTAGLFWQCISTQQTLDQISGQVL